MKSLPINHIQRGFILGVMIYLQFIPVNVLAQNQIWYFGDKAGIDFNVNPPVALTNGVMMAEEGCATICDSNGNLLFYSNGTNVYNRNHTVMPNGTGLKGDVSTSQGVLIVPDPGDSMEFYIFTLDDLAGADGMQYSKVDMSLQSGLGDVTTKNTPLHTNMTEKMVALQRCDGNIWVISHEFGSNNFFADLITPSGLSTTVISAVGSPHSGGGQGVINSVGQMALSQQGDRLAIAMRDNNIFEVFDFDPATGIVSNPVTLSNFAYYRSYGVEFSPDGSKLYGSCLNAGKVYQFDLNAGNAATIMSSAVLVGSVSALASALKLGPDGKIYTARAIGQWNGLGYLATISFPNALGTACNFQDNAFNLQGEKSLIGLPSTFIKQGGYGALTISGDTSICAGDTATLTVTGASSVQWVQGSSAATSTISVTPGSTTTYLAVDPNSVCSDTVSITVKVDPGGGLQISASDTLMCLGDSVTLTATGPGSTGNFQWSGGGVNSSQSTVAVSPQATTQYYLGGGNGPCAGHDTVTIHVLQQLQAQFSYSASPCGLSVDFNSTTAGVDSYNWDFGDNSSASGATVNHTYTVSGTYRVTLQVINSDCNLTDTISEVIVVSDSVPKPEIVIGDNDGCMDGTVNFEVKNAAPRYTYDWDFDNGSYSSSIAPQVKYSNTGTYNVALIIEDTLCGKLYGDTAVLLLDRIYTEVLIPNCFTPNEDGVNEFFTISGSSCGPGDVMEIYNRWGTLVFRTENPYEEFWDGYFKGSPCSQGVYFYLFFTQDEVKRGIITLMR